MYYKESTYGTLSSIIEKIRILLTDDQKGRFNEDFKIFDEIQKEIDSYYDYITKQRNEFEEFYNKYNKELEKYCDIKTNIKFQEKEIMKIKEELENNFRDEKMQNI